MGNRTAKKPTATEVAEAIGNDEATIASLEDAIAEIGNAERQVFSLRDKLQGITKSVKPKRVMVFLDLDAVAAWNEVITALREVKNQIDFFETADGIAPEVLSNAQAKSVALEAEAETAAQTMLLSALAVQLKPIPRIIAKDARRKAKKAIGVESGKVPADKQDDWETALNRIILGKMLVEVRDAEGNIYDNDAKALEDLLPESQWGKLLQAMSKLTFEDAVANSATDDPGF